MSNFQIYNTNKTQVFPETKNNDATDDLINSIIDNAIEFYINLKEERVISLLRADAPHVEGRDKANFYVDFTPDSYTNLCYQLVSRLDQHSSNTGWSFHTDESRWAIPWFITNNSVEDPAELDFSMVSLITVKDLVQDQKSMDFGFSGYKDASAVLSYFLNQESTEATYAIASNGRKRIIQSAEIVLEPGRHDNFELLSEATRDLISKRHEDLREEALSFYRDDVLEYVKSIARDSELTPIQSWDELHIIENYLTDSDKKSIPSSKLNTNSGNSVVNRTKTLKVGENISEAPPVELLDSGTRDQITEQAMNLIKEERDNLDQRLFEEILDFVNDNLSDLEEEKTGSAYAGLISIEKQVSGGNVETDLSNRADQSVNNIVSLLNDIRSSDFLTTEKKDSLIQIVKDRLSEFNSELRDDRVDKIQDEIDACIRGFPAKQTAAAGEIAAYADIIKTSIEDLSQIDNLPQSVVRYEQNINQIIDKISKDKIIEINSKETLTNDFSKRIVEYEQEVIEHRKNKIKSKIDQKLDSLNNSCTTYNEFEILSNRNYVFIQSHGIKHLELKPFREILDEINNTPVFANQDVEDLKNILRRKLNARHSEIIEQEKRKLVENIETCRRNFLSKNSEKDAQIKMEKLISIRRFIQGKINEKGLPDEIAGSYRRKLKNLSNNSNHRILNSKHIDEVRDRIINDWEETFDELASDYKEQRGSKLRDEIKALNKTISTDYGNKIRILRKLQAIIDEDSSFQSDKFRTSDINPDYRYQVKKLIDIIRDTKNSEHCIPHKTRNEIWESADELLAASISEAQKNLVKKRKKSLENSIRQDYSNISQSNKNFQQSINYLQEKVKELRNMKLHIQNRGTPPSIPDDMAEEIDIIDSGLLTKSQQEEISNALVQVLENKTIQLQENIVHNFVKYSNKEINKIDRLDDNVVSIEKLQAISDLIDTSSESDISQLSNPLVQQFNIVEDLEYEPIDFEPLHAEIENTIEDQLEAHAEDMRCQVKNVCERANDPNKIINKFSNYLEGGDGTIDEIEDAELKDVCDKYSRIHELYVADVISEEQFSMYKSVLIDEIEELDQSIDSEGVMDTAKDTAKEFFGLD